MFTSDLSRPKINIELEFQEDPGDIIWYIPMTMLHQADKVVVRWPDGMRVVKDKYVRD